MTKKCPDYRGCLQKIQSHCGSQRQRMADCTFHDEEPSRVASRRVAQVRVLFQLAPTERSVTAFRITPLSSKSLIHFLSVVATIMNINVTVMANNNGFSVACHHKFSPSWRFCASSVFLFDIFEFSDVMDIDFF